MHLHLVEPRPDGHRMQYVRRLIEQAPPDWQISLSTFASAFGHPGTVAAVNAAKGRLRLVPISGEAEFESKTQGSGSLASQVAYWRLFRRHWRSIPSEDRGEWVVVPFLDYCSYAIGLMGSPFGSTRFSGIVMLPDFHWSAQGVNAPKTRLATLKRLLFLRLLRHPRLARLVTIDPSLRDWVASTRPIGQERLRYADDPSDMQLAGDRWFARRQFGLREQAFVILVFGSIDLRKGLGDLIDVASGPDFPADAQLLIVGKQSEAATSLLAAHSHRLRPQTLVCVDRYVGRDEESLAFAAADCGWIAYENYYGSSGVLAQCDQARLPVIHRGKGIVGYIVAARPAVEWNWLTNKNLWAASPPPFVAEYRPLGQVFEAGDALPRSARATDMIYSGEN